MSRAVFWANAGVPPEIAHMTHTHVAKQGGCNNNPTAGTFYVFLPSSLERVVVESRVRGLLQLCAHDGPQMPEALPYAAYK